MSYVHGGVLLSFCPLWNSLKGALFLFVLFSLPSCIATKQELLEERARQSALEALAEEIQAAQQRQKQALRGEIIEADRQINRLRTIIDETQSIFGRNTADLGLRTQELISQMQLLRGEIEIMQKRLLELEEELSAVRAEQVAAVTSEKFPKSGAIEKTPLPEIERPQNPNEFYQLIIALWKAERYADARTLADEFLAKWKNHSLASTVRFTIGETYLDERNYQPAIVAYKRVLDLHKKSDHVPAALYKIGVCFLSMGMKQEAKVSFEEVIAKYPQSPFAEKAKKRIKYTN
ncbi:MAG: tol-pal system protein YbgF [Myxococcota bacterium]